MNIQQIIRAIRHIHKPQRLIPPVRNIPHLLLTAIRLAHTRLRFAVRLLRGYVAHGELLRYAGLLVTQRISTLVRGGYGKQLPGALHGGPHGECAVVGDNLEGGGEFGAGVVVDAAFGDVVPDVGVEDGGGVGGGHGDGLPVGSWC